MREIDSLKKLAEGATPGPWVLTFEDPEGFPCIYLDKDKKVDITFKDMNYIDAFSPEIVLKLLAVVEAAMNDPNPSYAVWVCLRALGYDFKDTKINGGQLQ